MSDSRRSTGNGTPPRTLRRLGQVSLNDLDSGNDNNAGDGVGEGEADGEEDKEGAARLSLTLDGESFNHGQRRWRG